jgi:hypothetical protein
MPLNADLWKPYLYAKTSPPNIDHTLVHAFAHPYFTDVRETFHTSDANITYYACNLSSADYQASNLT